jgi:diacylglycerol kinase (ATP)
MIENISTPEKILFVLNPISGGRDKAALQPILEKFCLNHNIEFSIYSTTGHKDKEAIKSKLSAFSPEVLVAIGGDGTVNLCASVIKFSECTLSIIPLGSGNGLAKDLNIPQNNVEQALELLINPSFKRIDTLEANGHFFLHLCDIGFNAQIVKSYSMSSRRGLITYAYYMIKTFFNYKSSRYYVNVDDKGLFKVTAFMITAANSQRFGSNITINPNGKVDDGLFELIIIKAFSYKVLPKLIWQILWKRIHFSPYSKIFTSKKVVIQHKRGKTLQVDGEILGRFKLIEILIHPLSVKVVVPKEPA